MTIALVYPAKPSLVARWAKLFSSPETPFDIRRSNKGKRKEKKSRLGSPAEMLKQKKSR